MDRTCRGCGKSSDISTFPPDGRCKDGISKRCASCKTVSDRGKFKKGQAKPKGSGRPPGGKNKVTLAAKDFAQELLDDKEYRDNLKERILSGRAANIEMYMWNRCVGKPVETLEVRAAEPLFSMDSEATPALHRFRAACEEREETEEEKNAEGTAVDGADS